MIQVTKEVLLAHLKNHIGRTNGVTARKLVTEITGTPSTVQERKLRQLVEELRNEGIAVCADPSSGYHIARDAEELQASIRFLTDRIATSARQVRALKRIARPSLHGQRRLMLS